TQFISGWTAVAFDATSVAIGALSPTQIEVVSPAHVAGPILITVTTPGGAATGAYAYHDPPTLATVSPAAGPVAGGQAVTISGAHYVPDQTTVAFGGAAATVVTTLTGSIDVLTPARPAGPVSVVVTTPGGTVTALSAYRYHDPPTLATVSPSSGPSVGGATLTLTGTNFVPGQTTVSFSGDPGGAVVAPAGTSLTATTPPRAAGPANVVVTTPGGSAALAGAYVYHDAPTIAAVSPGSGSTQGGQTVTITGTNFAPGETAVLFGGTAGSGVVVGSPGSLTVVSPAHATGAVDVVVRTPGGEAASAGAYAYAGPFIASVAPVAGPVAGGQTVTLTGTGFVPGSTSLTLGGAPVAPVSVSATSLSFVAPPGAGSGAVDVAVTTPDGTYVAADGYAYVGFPSISAVTPSRGPASGGATLVIDGADFAPGNMTVTVGGAAAAIASSTVTQAVVTTPAHAGGTVDVVVTTFGNQPATALGAYTYVDAPVVAAIVPDRGSTAGGQSVVIRGLRFEPGETSVALGGAPATSVVVDPDGTRLTAVTTARGPGLVHVVVTTFGLQSGSRPGGYTYVDPSTAADLALTMDVDDASPALGQEVVFTLSLSNSGQLASPGTRVSDPLPAGLAFVSAVASQGAYDPGSGEWTVGALAAGAGATLSIVARVESSGLLVNAAEVSASSAPDLDSTPGNGVPEEDDRVEIALTAALAIGTDAALPSATSTARYFLRLAASGGRPPYRWSFVAGTLPFHLDSLTGEVSGVAPEVASDTVYAFTLRLQDAEDPPASVTRDFSLTSHPMNVAAPTIRGVSPSPAGVVGAALFHVFSAVDGQPPYAWQVVAGAPPPGLFLDARGGRLAGAPVATGSFTFTIRVRDARGVDSASPVTVHVLANPTAIGPAEVVGGSLGSPYAQSLELSGGVGPGFAWTVSAGALPDGLTLTGAGRHAEIAGTPSKAGTFAFTVRAADGGQAGLAATRSYVLTIAAAGGPLTVVPRTLPPGTAGVLYSARLTATGSGPPAWTLAAGSLPAGLALNATTGVISGVPAFAGDVRFVAAAGPTASAGFDLRIAPAPLVVSVAPPFGVVGEAYYLELRALGGVAPVRWSLVTGSLPAGLSLDAAAGTLQGVPAGAGTVFTLEARDARGAAASATFTLNVLDAAAGLAALGTSPRWGEVGVPYSDSLTAVGGTPPYAWSLASGALPPWSGFTASTGTLAGLPDAPGRVLFAASVGDSAAPSAASSTSGTLTLDIFDPLAVETSALPGAVEATPYAHTLSATGVAAPARWRVVSGSLPDGFSLGATSGVLSGTTAGLGVRSFRVEVTDATGRRATRTLSVATTLLQEEGSVSGSECSAAAGGAGGLGWIWAAAALAFVRRPRKEAR
ncbi:MAG TPA: IPT/TIG domain-containing protein, partial [Planctomycetota bacterium]